MRRRAFLAAAAAAFCACHPPKADPSTAAVAARARAHESQLDRLDGTHGGSLPLADSARKAVVLGKDAAGCSWIEAEGLVTVSEQETRHQARAAAIEEARESAMQDFLGVEVKSRFMDFQQEGLRDQEHLTEDILQTTRLGRILKEEIVSEGYKDAGDCAACRYQVKSKICLAEVPKDADRDFQVELELSRARFVEGDEARITVKASKDCYIYLYDVGMDWETSLLIPNGAMPEVKLKAGQVWEYPDEEIRKSGIKLVAQVPEGKNVSAETIRLIATKTPLPMKKEDPAMGGYLSLLRRLNSSKVDWAEDAQAFTIYRK